mgnify:FL=1
MIITVPNKVLTTPAKPVEKIDKKIKQIIQQMKDDLIYKENPKGVGLAAPQIGIPLRIFIIKPAETSPVEVFINPQISWRSKDLAEIERPNDSKPSLRKERPALPAGRKLEGCLSIPNVWGYLKRPKKVKLSYLDENGTHQEKEFESFKATIVQHETDHINGILFTQRVLEQKQKLYRIEEDDDGEEELVEIEL